MEQGRTTGTYLNQLIKDLSDKVDIGYISDGWNTFDELYGAINILESEIINTQYSNSAYKVRESPEFMIVVVFITTETSIHKLYPSEYWEYFKIPIRHKVYEDTTEMYGITDLNFIRRITQVEHKRYSVGDFINKNKTIYEHTPSSFEDVLGVIYEVGDTYIKVCDCFNVIETSISELFCPMLCSTTLFGNPELAFHRNDSTVEEYGNFPHKGEYYIPSTNELYTITTLLRKYKYTRYTDKIKSSILLSSSTVRDEENNYYCITSTLDSPLINYTSLLEENTKGVIIPCLTLSI